MYTMQKLQTQDDWLETNKRIIVLQPPPSIKKENIMKFANIKKRYALIVRHWQAWREVDISYISNDFGRIQKIYQDEYRRVDSEKRLNPDANVILLDLKEKRILKGDVCPNLIDFAFHYRALVDNAGKIKYLK